MKIKRDCHMKKSSKKKSGRISAIALIPIIAVIIAVPVILTKLVEAPIDGIGGGTPSVETSVTGSGSTSEGSGNPGPSGTSPSLPDDSPAALSDISNPNDSSFLPPGGSVPEASESQDFSEPSQEEAGDAEQSASSLPAEDTDIPTPPCTLDDIPSYSGELYCVINNNVPFFQTPTDAAESFERYAPLDSLGRCGTAFANIGQDLMPTEERGAIGQIRPSGWHTVKYEGIDGNYLYNRCHLIAYQLAGENANERNLITGTRTFNAVGMLSFEETAGNYVRATGHHVLYRVTPMFRGNNLVADGVLMEAWSVEDHGAGVCFNVFVYNVQPGIVIDYATGDSYASPDLHVADSGASPADLSGSPEQGSQGDSGTGSPQENTDTSDTDNPQENTGIPGTDASQNSSPGSGENTDSDINHAEPPAADYVLNTNTGKFHYPDCSSVQEMAEHNKLYYSGSREDVIAMGYVPCKRCNP